MISTQVARTRSAAPQRSLATAPKPNACAPSARPRLRLLRPPSASAAPPPTGRRTGAAAAPGPTTGRRRDAASVATTAPGAADSVTATRAAAASVTRAAAALVMRVPEGAAASVMLAGAALEMMLLPVGAVSRMVPLLAEALVIRELRRAAAASKMGLLSGRALRTTGVRPHGEVRPSRTGPLLGEAGSRTGAPRRADRRPEAMGNPMEAVCGAAAAQLLLVLRPRGRSAGASRSLAAGRTARPTRRTTGAAAAATRRRRRHFHPLFPPV